MYEPLEIAEEKMEKTLSSRAEDYSTIRAGRANPNVLNKITVDYYGSPTPLQQVANISVPEARMLVIQPWDRSLIKAIEKAILTSNLGINPSNDGRNIRLVIPVVITKKTSLAFNVWLTADGVEVMGMEGDVVAGDFLSLRRTGRALLTAETESWIGLIRPDGTVVMSLEKEE